MKYVSLLLVIVLLASCASTKSSITYSNVSNYLETNPIVACIHKNHLSYSDISHATLFSIGVRMPLSSIKGLDYDDYAYNILYPDDNFLDPDRYFIRLDNPAEDVEKKFIEYFSKDGEWVTTEFCKKFSKDEIVKANMIKLKQQADQKAELLRLQDEKTCREDFGFKEGTEAYSNCLMKQNELRALEKIAEENKSTVINEAPKKSRGGSTFCQKMPGAYTTTYHCW